ncbi:MAG TPA: electron transfer flavoprotein subunit alpha/FixB family protein [Longimicrobiales bacterium]|nr:electron transfer flavoprotein subunit alpha/FixB family protein [Longimicrobiales bacterium]
MANILAVVEQRDGALRRISGEVVTAAKQIADATGGEVHAVVVGAAGGASGADGLGRFGAARVVQVEGEGLDRYVAEAYAAAVADLAREGKYYAVLFGASAQGRDLAPRVAARLDVPLAGDATGLAVEAGELLVTRPVYAGRAFAQLTIKAEPRLVSVRPNTFRPREAAAAGTVETRQAAAGADAARTRVREVRAATGGRLDVGEAPIVVAGGRGMKGPENWQALEDLVDALGPTAALGASRAVVDAGWRPHGEQVGQTGKTVSPQLYFAVGISGAMQHLAGMRSAKTIVAINKDPDAPIFKVADYGVVGDAAEVLPRLAEEIRSIAR